MRDSSSSYSLHPFWLMGTINRLEPSLESSCYSWFWPLPWPSACWFFVPSTRSSSRVRCMTSSFVITKLALECFAGGSSPSFFNRARARRKSSWTQMSWKAWRTLETSSRVSRRLKLETSGRWIGQKEIWNKIPLMRVWRKHICLSCRYQIKGIAAFRGLTSTNRLRRLALTVSLILHTVHRCTSRSEALVIVASKQILTRPWCAVEICSAVANKVMACHVADISRDWCSFCASHVSFVKWTRGCFPPRQVDIMILQCSDFKFYDGEGFEALREGWTSSDLLIFAQNAIDPLIIEESYRVLPGNSPGMKLSGFWVGKLQFFFPKPHITHFQVCLWWSSTHLAPKRRWLQQWLHFYRWLALPAAVRAAVRAPVPAAVQAWWLALRAMPVATWKRRSWFWAKRSALRDEWLVWCWRAWSWSAFVAPSCSWPRSVKHPNWQGMQSTSL